MTRSRAPEIIQAFTDEQVSRLTGLTVGQLRYWDRTEFFRPSFAVEGEGARTAGRFYSFRDVASLRVIAQLRAHVSLQHLREVGRRLTHLSDERWTATKLFVVKKRVVFRDAAGPLREVVSGQMVFSIALRAVSADVGAAIKQLSDRSEKVGQVERNRRVQSNLPVVAGTRIPVALIKRMRDRGVSVEEILREYPSLTEADVQAADAYQAGKSAA